VHFDVISIFPEMFAALSEHGVTARGFKQERWTSRLWNPRDFTEDTYRRIDDRPYGGGPGMVMMPGPISLCLDAIGLDVVQANPVEASAETKPQTPVILMSPQGRTLNQALILELAKYPRLCLIAGRYEALDQRLIDSRVSMEISIGDFVVSGGELPAMMLMDALIRRIPGVVNDGDSILQDSFEDGLLDCPHYTRPENFEGQQVPEVLLSGHHLNIERWRRDEKLKVTWQRRPDLIRFAENSATLSKLDQRVLSSFGWSPLGKLDKAAEKKL
jgi:tRNA (guanine37-N1)-methyltransferase